MRSRHPRMGDARRRPSRRRCARSLKVTLGILLLAGLVSAPAFSRPVVGKIRGTVVDTTNSPLSGLMVQLSSKDDNGVLRVTGTDEQGRYLFRDLPAGVYEIVVGANGYERASKVGIEVRPPFQNIVGFVLSRSSAAADAGAASVAGPALDAMRPNAGDARGSGNGDGVMPDLVSTIGADAITVPVRGLFVNKDRHGIPEVSVTFIGLETGGVYQALSGKDGAFLLEAVPVGLYRVLVSSPGHVALDLPSVEVAEPGGLNLSLSLVDYPLNSRERLGVVVLPGERARPVPAESRFPDGEGAADRFGAPAAGSGSAGERDDRRTEDPSGETPAGEGDEAENAAGSKDEDSGSV